MKRAVCGWSRPTRSFVVVVGVQHKTLRVGALLMIPVDTHAVATEVGFRCVRASWCKHVVSNDLCLQWLCMCVFKFCCCKVNENEGRPTGFTHGTVSRGSITVNSYDPKQVHIHSNII